MLVFDHKLYKSLKKLYWLIYIYFGWKLKGWRSLKPKGTQDSRGHLKTFEAHKRPAHHRMGTTPLESKETCNSTATSLVGIFFNYSALELTFQGTENLLLKSIYSVVSELAISYDGKIKIYHLRLFLVFCLTTCHAVVQMVSGQFLITIPGIDPSRVGFVVDNVALGDVSLRVLRHSSVRDIPAIPHTHSSSVT